jgi:hypothetical protein
MNVSVKELKKQALALSVAEREELAESLLESTHNKEVTEIDRQWISVAEERYEYLASGKESGIGESDFFSKIEEKLGWK